MLPLEKDERFLLRGATFVARDAPVPLLPFVTQGRCVRSGVSFCRRPRRAGRFQSMATHPWSLREAFRILSPSLRIEIVYLQRLGKVNAFFRAARPSSFLLICAVVHVFHFAFSFLRSMRNLSCIPPGFSFRCVSFFERNLRFPHFVLH